MTPKKPQASLVLKVSVLVGSLTLLLGLTGLVVVLVRGDVPHRIRVVIEDLPADAQYEVRVQWRDGESLVSQEAHPGAEPSVWVLPPVPPSTPLTILVQEAGTRPPRVLTWAEVPEAQQVDRIVLSMGSPPSTNDPNDPNDPKDPDDPAPPR